MRFDHLKSLYLSGGVLVMLLASGFLLSKQKLLWNDELYTQNTAIDADSYAGLLSFKFPDGNKNPLFYIIQKTVCNIFSYHMPAAYANGLNRTRDIPSQIILRIPSNIYMSLALALIFYFFTRFYSIFAALYALSVALVSPMVWMYWVEARPYSLWFLLTTAQLLLLCCAFISPKIKIIKILCLTHILLALTTPASMFQISIAAFMVWRKKKVNTKQLALIWVLPTGIALFYCFFDYLSTIKTYMFSSNLFDVVMPERLFIYVIYALTAWGLPEKYKEYSWNIFFLPVFLLFFASGFFVLYKDLFTQNSQQGFFSRYLIYLTPADILMFSLASFDLRRWSRQAPWICMNVSIFLGGLVIIRGLMTYREILAAATYLHSPA
jgi:hypothetical protein